MNEKNKNSNLITKIRDIFIKNFKILTLTITIIFIIFILFQVYNYFKVRELKKTSTDFFNSIDEVNLIDDNFNDIKNKKNIFSILSYLKLIQKNNDDNNYDISNELYRELLLSDDLSNLYKSSIAIHASYTFIDASYLQNSNVYFDDLLFFTDNIDENIESFYGIKKELEYLIIITEIDLNNSDYKNNSKAIDMYNEISNSDLISSSIKERVKKIHEFQLYK